MQVSSISYGASAQALNGPKVLQDPSSITRATAETNMAIAKKQWQAALQQVQPISQSSERQGLKKIDVYV